MAKREIKTYLGGQTGENLARFIWRSRPTVSPHTGRPIRCVVAQDEKGQYWSGTRIGPGRSEKAQYEFWIDPSTNRNAAIAGSREHTRAFLSAEAEFYSATVTSTKPGQKIVEVTMDDGWSVAINAAGRITPAEARVMKRFEEFGRDKKPPRKSRPRGRSIDR